MDVLADECDGVMTATVAASAERAAAGSYESAVDEDVVDDAIRVDA
jgi:hypothetical protein